MLGWLERIVWDGEVAQEGVQCRGEGGSRSAHSTETDYHSSVHSSRLTLLVFTLTTGRLFCVFRRFLTKGFSVSRPLWYCTRFLILFFVIFNVSARLYLNSEHRTKDKVLSIDCKKVLSDSSVVSFVYCWVKTTSFRRQEMLKYN